MTPGLRRVRAALLGLGLLATAAVFLCSSPTAAQAAGCTSPQVAVLVDLSHWGGSDRVGCVSWGSSLTGYQALHSAGFSTTGTVHDGPAFVCRIDGYPSAGAPDHEACVSTPPATRFWSYWHAEPGQSSWTFSTLGAVSYHPRAGSADAWTFGAGAAPSVSPSAALPGAASPSTSPAATSKSTGPPSTHRSTSRSTAPATHHSASTRPNSSSTRPTGAAASSAPPTTSPSGAASPSSAATGSAGTTSAAAESSPSRTGGLTIAIGRAPTVVTNRSSDAATPTKASGSPGPTIAGVVIVAVLAAGGGFYAWRRRELRSHAD